MIRQVEEKEGGARNVISWDVRVAREYHPVYLLTGGRYGYDSPNSSTVHISVEFDDDASAVEFEAKVRAMLPEVRK